MVTLCFPESPTRASLCPLGPRATCGTSCWLPLADRLPSPPSPRPPPWASSLPLKGTTAVGVTNEGRVLAEPRAACPPAGHCPASRLQRLPSPLVPLPPPARKAKPRAPPHSNEPRAGAVSRGLQGPAGASTPLETGRRPWEAGPSPSLPAVPRPDPFPPSVLGGLLRLAVTHTPHASPIFGLRIDGFQRLRSRRCRGPRSNPFLTLERNSLPIRSDTRFSPGAPGTHGSTFRRCAVARWEQFASSSDAVTEYAAFFGFFFLLWLLSRNTLLLLISFSLCSGDNIMMGPPRGDTLE